MAAAQAGDDAAFVELVERHRPELRVHCYRMLGSFSEAEDLVQETFLRAWSKIDSFEGRSSFRAWLYKIATNACLDELAGRPRRLLAYDVVAAADPGVPPLSLEEYRCVEPYPDRLLAGLGDDPGDDVVAKETIELAFLVAIQHLSPIQRATVILRDVLGWSAKANADLLDVSEAAVKRALQRARPILRERLPERRQEWAPESDPTLAERVVLQRYMDAHERDDVEALAELLLEDVRVRYAPYALWCDSRESFILGSRKFAPPGDYRFVAIRANMQPAAAIYLPPPSWRHGLPPDRARGAAHRGRPDRRDRRPRPPWARRGVRPPGRTVKVATIPFPPTRRLNLWPPERPWPSNEQEHQRWPTTSTTQLTPRPTPRLPPSRTRISPGCSASSARGT